MISSMIRGATRIIGKSQGYLGLAVRDEVYQCGTPAMVSAWEPTPAEIERLKAGARIEVTLLGDMHPPIKVDVGEVSE